MDEITIGQAIRKARGNVTLKELAQRTGYSLTYLSDVQCDKTAPSLKALMAIAKALDIRPGAILDAMVNPGIFAIEAWRKRVLDLYLNGYPGEPVLDPNEKMGKSPLEQAYPAIVAAVEIDKYHRDKEQP